MKIGIDIIKFYTPHFYITAEDLANTRNINPNKYLQDLGISKLSILPPDEDIVTMATNAAVQALKYVDISTIKTLLFATESGIDYAKSAGMWVHKLLNLPSTCRVVELKQACYSATAALHFAIAIVSKNPKNKVLILSSDNAKYELNSPGEPTQGCGAAAIVVSANPRILTINDKTGIYTKDSMDFWRPNYKTEPFVRGKYSMKLYLTTLNECWKNYIKNSKLDFNQHYNFCYHSPFPTMAEKAHIFLFKKNNNQITNSELLIKQIFPSLIYGKNTGNTYTASLYICFISLLENTIENLSNKLIGFYSYGSGSIGEFFSGNIEKSYKDVIDIKEHEALIKNRKQVNIKQYEEFHNFIPNLLDGNYCIPYYNNSCFRLSGYQNHMRIYEKNCNNRTSHFS